MLQQYFVDLHIHIGRDIYDRPVKITASKNLTLTNILEESSRRKGLQMIGVIDCHAPAVQEELQQLIEANKAIPLKNGGIQFENVTLILGAELEIYDENCQGPIHVLCYLPTIDKMQQFTEWLRPKMKNITLSSQRIYVDAKALQYKVKELAGIFIPAHVFTPFKSLYGKGVHTSLSEVFDPDLIDGIELGLSADTYMADNISELHRYTFVTNSDSHSLPKIAREYQLIEMKEPTFNELWFALHGAEGRRVVTNYGMNPLLGKYYTTVCQQCFAPATFGSLICEKCNSTKIINGVYDRIQTLKDNEENINKRPDYMYQVPLEYIKGLGPKSMEKLLENGKTEMHIIHHMPQDILEKYVKPTIAAQIIQLRHGKLQIEAGGGGKYGKLK